MKKLLLLCLFCFAATAAKAQTTCGQTSTAAGFIATNTNIAIAQQCTPTVGGTPVSIGINIQTSVGAWFDFGLYSDSGGKPGTMLCHSAAGRNIPSGASQIALTGCPALASGVPIWISWLAGANSTLQGYSGASPCSASMPLPVLGPSSGTGSLPTPSFGSTTAVSSLAGCLALSVTMSGSFPPSHSASLAWTQGTTDGGLCPNGIGPDPVTGNNVYRSTTSGAETLLQVIPAPSVSFTDTNVTAGVTYFYQVTAINCNGESQKSAETSATIPSGSQLPSAPPGLAGVVR